MTLQASFNHPVADAQHAFRRILKAMSEPGTVVALPLQQGWGQVSPAATAALLTLVDHETPVWLDAALNDDAVRSNLRFYTGAALAEDQAAPFALIQAASAIDFSRFTAGDDLAPEKSTTVIIEVAALAGGEPLRLSGPGLQAPRTVAPRLPAALRRYLSQRANAFPQGIDLMLTSGMALMALPRTTHVEVC